MIRICFINQDVPRYIVKCSPQRLVKFGCLFTIVYKKDVNFYVNGFFGRSVINVSGDGCVGGFCLTFHPDTLIKQVI